MLVIVYGPTGVGKTEIVQKLAETMPIAMVNMDMGQLYTPLSIGTAKPDMAQLSMPHYLFNVLDTPTYTTVHDYRSWVKEAIAKSESNGQIPVLVGGSSFYLRSLFFPVSEQSVAPVPLPKKETWWEELQKIDPVRAQAIHPQDYYRLKRALTIWHSTGKKPSSYKPEFKPIVSTCLIIGLIRDRDELYARINQRVPEMFRTGWIEEVENLGHDWHTFLKEKKIIGYDSIVNYLKEPYSQEELIEEIAQKTRNYAKRQLSFWRSFSKLLTNSATQYNELSYTVMTINLSSGNEAVHLSELQSAINHIKGRND